MYEKRQIMRRSGGGCVLAVLTLLLLLPLPASALWGRIKISQAMIPYTITNEGSYVVTDDLVNSNSLQPIITIEASYVTLDLAGHTLTQWMDHHAIYSASDYITIRNGTITFPGTDGDYGIYLNSDYNRIEDIRCVDFKDIGLYTDDGSLLRNCLVAKGGGTWGLYGISIGSGTAILGCQVSDFQGGFISPMGIHADVGCLIADSLVVSNYSAGTPISGIRSSRGSLVTHCIVKDIQGAGATCGIEAGDGCMMLECAVSGIEQTTNATDTCILAGSGALVNGCTVEGAQNGIWLNNGSIALGNIVRDTSDVGINVETGSLVRLNTLSEAKIKTGSSSMVVENKLWNRNSGAPIDLVEVDSHCYVLENYIWGWGDGVELLGSHNRIDRNFMSCVPEVDAQGAYNLIIRNRSNNWGMTGTNDDFFATGISGSAGMSDDEPWANVTF